jgi:hypothetical protein
MVNRKTPPVGRDARSGALRGRDALLRVRRCTSGNHSNPVTVFPPFLCAYPRCTDVQRRSRGSASLPRSWECFAFLRSLDVRARIARGSASLPRAIANHVFFPNIPAICPRTNCSTAGSAVATEDVSSWRQSKESPATETRSARGLALNMACA